MKNEYSEHQTDPLLCIFLMILVIALGILRLMRICCTCAGSLGVGVGRGGIGMHKSPGTQPLR